MKVLTYGVMHFMVAFMVSFLLTGSVKVAGLIAIIEPLIQTFAYFFHEKAWEQHSKSKQFDVAKPQCV